MVAKARQSWRDGESMAAWIEPNDEDHTGPSPTPSDSREGQQPAERLGKSAVGVPASSPACQEVTRNNEQRSMNCPPSSSCVIFHLSATDRRGDCVSLCDAHANRSIPSIPPHSPITTMNISTMICDHSACWNRSDRSGSIGCQAKEYANRHELLQILPQQQQPTNAKAPPGSPNQSHPPRYHPRRYPRVRTLDSQS